jgi:bacillithiol system protein YtxJ
MGLFNLFKSESASSSGQKNAVNWNSLTTEEQLDKLVAESSKKLQLIFKNSTSCGISGMVFRSFEAHYPLAPGQADLHLLHIQHNRQLSAMISQRFEIRHESPQLLIIKNGTVVKHASHSGISDVSVETYI